MQICKKMILIGIVLIFSSCNKDVIKGEGPVVTETLSVSDFTGVNLTFSNNILIKQGDIQEVKAIGHRNIINRIRTSVTNDFWKISLEEGSYREYTLSLEITVPNLNKLRLSGSGHLNINNFINQNDMDIRISGSGDIILNKFEGVVDLNIEMSGSGDFRVNNDISTLNTLNVRNSGSGKYVGFKLSSDSAFVKLSGSGDVELTAHTLLDVKLSGSGDIYYKKTPTIRRKITGSGSLIYVK